jgi:hypothetical protein
MIYHIMGKPLYRQFLLAPKEGVASLCGAVVAMAGETGQNSIFTASHLCLTTITLRYLPAKARFHLAATERAINVSALIEEMVAHEAARKKITGRKPLLPHGGASAVAN